MNLKLATCEQLLAQSEEASKEGIALLDRLTNPRNRHYIRPNTDGYSMASYSASQWFVQAAHLANLAESQTPEKIREEKTQIGKDARLSASEIVIKSEGVETLLGNVEHMLSLGQEDFADANVKEALGELYLIEQAARNLRFKLQYNYS
jgi:hypothetical protein